MKLPLRIAILEADTPAPKTNEKYKGYGGVFTALLNAGADALDEPERISSQKGMEITAWDVVTEQKYPAFEDIDAVLISGSKFNSFDDTPWILKLVEYTEKLLQQDRIRIIGVCFGHQIIARAMGAKLGRNDLGWEVSACIVKLTDKGKEVFNTETMTIHQMHRDIVFEYPPGVEYLGHSPVCHVQGMYSRNRIISVQGHPEFNKQMVEELLEIRHDQGIFNDEVYRDGMDRVGHHQDGVKVAQAFLRFLLDD